MTEQGRKARSARTAAWLFAIASVVTHAGAALASGANSEISPDVALANVEAALTAREGELESRVQAHAARIATLSTAKGNESVGRRFSATQRAIADATARAFVELRGHLGDTKSPELRFSPDVSESRRASLREGAARLEARSRELRDRELRFTEGAIDDLSALKVRLFAELPAEKRSDLLGLSARARAAAGVELAQIAARIGLRINARAAQLRNRLSFVDDWLALGALLWSLVELLLIALALRFARRRWSRWMTAVIAAIGRVVNLGSGALLAARIAELAREFGPPLLVLAAASAAYLVLGGSQSAPEVHALFVVVAWLSLARAQLRFVEALARSIGIRRNERRAQRHDLSRDTSETAEAPATPRSTTSPSLAALTGVADDIDVNHEPGWKLVARSWRQVTRLAATAIVLTRLISLSVGHAVLYSMTLRATATLALLLAFVLLHRWRHRIVRAYFSRTDSANATDGALHLFTQRHARRFYGALVVIPVLVIVLARHVAGFVRRHLSNLDWTKRVLAWMFRRRVEKHAQTHGRVLTRAHELPKPITEQFSLLPLTTEDRPTTPACLEELKRLFISWQETTDDGSVALVGASGMGKTTILQLLEAHLGEAVMHANVQTKITSPRQLVEHLAGLLGLDGKPTTEAELVALLHAEQRRVIALDNCHNLFLRQVGGFEAWEAFTRIVTESAHNVFWIVSFDGLAWSYLNNIAARISRFRSVIRLTPWTDTELRHLVLSRMRRSRYRPNFVDLLVTRLEGVSMSSQIIGTSEGYFRLLWDFTDGNPRDACHFWLRSLVPAEKGKRVRVHLFAAPNIDELQDLADDLVFVLQAVAEHENLTSSELAAVTNMSSEFCRFALRDCRDAGYLTRDPVTGSSRLSVHWHKTIIRFLKRQHLIYSKG